METQVGAGADDVVVVVGLELPALYKLLLAYEVQDEVAGSFGAYGMVVIGPRDSGGWV